MVAVSATLAETSPTMTIVTVPPGGSVPRSHVSARSQMPSVVDTDVNVTPAGARSTTLVPTDADGPALVTTSVYLTGEPATSEPALTVLTMPRSATWSTSVLAVAEPLAGTESGVVLDACAVLDTVAAVTSAPTLVVSTSEIESSGSSVPRAHVRSP